MDNDIASHVKALMEIVSNVIALIEMVKTPTDKRDKPNQETKKRKRKRR